MVDNTKALLTILAEMIELDNDPQVTAHELRLIVDGISDSRISDFGLMVKARADAAK